jgi:hypothetical protein
MTNNVVAKQMLLVNAALTDDQLESENEYRLINATTSQVDRYSYPYFSV